MTEVPHFAAIRTSEVLPGIDLRWRGVPGRGLEYDLQMAPGADAAAVRMRFEGAESIGLGKSGELLLGTKGGVLRHSGPLAWQERDGRRTDIPCAFRLHPSSEVGLGLGPYDRTLPVFVDPRVEYSTYFGGAGADTIARVAQDGDGNMYFAGSTLSADFPTQGPYQANRASVNGDAFVSKLDATGTTLLYSTYLGGNSLDAVYGLAVDSSNSVYLAGRTDSTDFPTSSPIQANRLNADGFLAKVAASGASLVYSTYLGGDALDYANDVALDGTGAAYVVGYTLSTDFPTQAPFQAAMGGTTDAFVCKVNAGGSALAYSTYLGGTSGEDVARIRVDGNGNAVVVGTTSSTNFPLQSPFQATMGVGPDIFISKFNSTGSALLYSSYLGGNGGSNPKDLVLDGSGAAYVTGSTASTNLATASAYQTDFGGAQDAFVMKIAPDGSAKSFLTYLGGTGSDSGFAVAVHSTGDLFVAGTTQSSDFPTVDPLQASLSGTQDAFLARFSADAGSLLFSTYRGGTGSEEVGGIGLLGASTPVVLAGTTTSTNFPVTAQYQGNNAGQTDGFLVRYATSPYPPPSGLGSSLAGPVAIQLGWTDNSDDETGFEIDRRVGTGPASLLTTVPADTVAYDDTGLATGTRYTYRVRAVNADGASDWSVETSTTTPPEIPGAPLSPSGLTVVPFSATQADLDWTDESSDETFFQIQRKVGTGTWQVLATPGANATSYSDDEILPDRTYAYRVRAYNGTGPSDYSEEATLMTPPSLEFVVTKGLIKDSATLARDILKIRGTMAVNGASPDGALDVVSEGFEVRLGGREGTPIVSIGPAAEEWVLRNGRATWKSPRGSVTKVKLIVEVGTGEWTLVLKKASFSPAPVNPIVLAFAVGNDAGAHSADWTAVPKRTGVYRLP